MTGTRIETASVTARLTRVSTETSFARVRAGSLAQPAASPGALD